MQLLKNFVLVDCVKDLIEPNNLSLIKQKLH